MSVSFKLRTTRKEGTANLTARIQAEKLGVNLLVKTPIEVDIFKYTASPKGKVYPAYMSSPEGIRIEDLKLKIKTAINSMTDAGTAITAEQAKKVIDDIYYKEERAQEAAMKAEKKRKEAEEKRVTLNKYIKMYLQQIKDGSRQTEKGTNYAESTKRSITTAMNQFEYFQEETHRRYDFDDIDMQFYYNYTAWLKKKSYSINTIGKCIKELKAILYTAETEGYHNNNRWKDKKFKGTRIEVDNIYLTRSELDKIIAADLSEYEIGHEWARDIFMVGCWTAQRVSDYNNIKKENIHHHSIQKITDNKIVTKEITTIDLRQQKTGAKVSIPVSTELREILEKYDYQLPHLEDQVINRYMKDVCMKAGLDDLVEIEETKGGTPVKVCKPKYDLVHTHTARRTGATLMYLSGMDIYDICRITGHSSPIMLRKYIKADNLEVADKITDKYDYFD